MARPHDGTTTRNDDTDVFAQLSHLLESNYLYDTSVDQFPSSSTSIRSATALGPRAENTRSSRNNFSTSSSPNDEDRISSSANILMTKKRNDAILNPANDSSHHTPNSSISFHAWRSKVHRNKDANSGSLKSTSASTHNGAKKVGPESSSHVSLLRLCERYWYHYHFCARNVFFCLHACLQHLHFDFSSKWRPHFFATYPYLSLFNRILQGGLHSWKE